MSWAEANERARKQHAANLEAKVLAVNAAHAYANKLHPELTEIFRPWVGKQVTKTNGQLLAKVEKLLPEFPASNAIHVFRHVTDYSLAWTIKTCECAQQVDDSRYSHANYCEVTIYIGDLDKGVLTKLCESYQDPPRYRTNFTAEEIVSARLAARQAEKMLDDAKSKYYPFGEHDL